MIRSDSRFVVRAFVAAALALTTGSVGLAGGGVAAAWAGPARPSAAAQARPLPGVSNCGSDKPIVRRRSFVIFCGDAGEVAARLRWSHLTATSGAATGRALANDCQPTCAAGHVHQYRAHYVFSRVREIHGAPAFTEVHITYTGKRTPYGHRRQANRLT